LVGRLLLANFPLLFATPVLVSALAFAVEISPWKVAVVAQLLVLGALWSALSVNMGADALIGMVGLWLPWLISAIAGVLLSGLGYGLVGRARKKYLPA
jgi:hypothetical protein